MVTVWSFYFQGIQTVDGEIVYRKTVEIRYRAVKDVCQGILCDRIDFFAVVYFYVTVTAGLITYVISLSTVFVSASSESSSVSLSVELSSSTASSSVYFAVITAYGSSNPYLESSVQL